MSDDFQKSWELGDRAWDAIPLAWAGAAVAMLVPLGGFALFVDTIVRDEMAVWQWIALGAITCAGIAAGIAMWMPWERAINDLREHRKRMEAKASKRL